MAVAQRKLALLGLAATGLPLVLAGALAVSGRELEAVLRLDQAFALALALAGGLVAVVWPLLALEPGAREGGLRARAHELLLLGAAFAPALRLASLLSRSSEEATARALVGLGALLVAQGGALAGLSRTRLPRPALVAAFVTLALALPLAGLYAEDAFGRDLGLARASIPAALLAQLRGDEDPWLLSAALAVTGALAAGLAARGGARALLLVALVATPAFAGDLELDPNDTRLLLGPRVRVGELAPVRLRVRAGARGFEGEVGVQSGGIAVHAPLKLPAGRTAELVLPAVGGGAGMRLIAGPAHAEPFALPPSTLQVLDSWVPLVALAPQVPRELELAVAPPGGATRVRETDDLLELAPLGGGALDVLVLGRGASEGLARFAALGGAIVVPDVPTLEGLARGAGPRRDTPLLARRDLGAGTLVAPLSSAGLAVLASSLSLHAHVRRDLGSIGRALSEQWSVPGPSPATAGKTALLAFVLLSALVVVLLVAGREPRATASFLLVSLALTALMPLLVFRQWAPAPVYLETATVLEAPSGGTTAGVVEVLRVASPRRIFAEIGLHSAPPLVGVFATEGEASRSLTELRLEGPAGTSLGEVPARLKVPLGPGIASTFARRSERSLEKPVVVSRDSVEYGLPWHLEQPLLLVGLSAIELEDLAPGETRRVSAAPVPFADLLRKARARPGFTERDRKRLALLAAALPTRGAAGTIRLTGFISSRLSSKVTSGVLEEATGETLLIVTER